LFNEGWAFFGIFETSKKSQSYNNLQASQLIVLASYLEGTFVAITTLLRDWHCLLQTRESRNVAYVAMTRAERVLYLSHVGPAEAANSFFLEAMLPEDVVKDI